MDKIIFPNEQEELLKAADGRLFSFFDDDSASMKKAASSAFSDKLIRENAPDSKHFGIHAIAMGAGEYYSFNKNADWWDEGDEKSGLIGRHHTFVTNGHYFREHRNTDPKLKIGDIKAAAYNKEQRRVELIIHGDKEKCPDIYEKAKQGKDVDGSMSARVKFDVCSICGNEAKSSKEYCSHAKYAMTQWLPKHAKFVYVRNPHPTFFDFSEVANKADRIARHLEYIFSPEEELKKAASAPSFMFSDLRASEAGILLPQDPNEILRGCGNAHKQQWLEKLAAAEIKLGQAETENLQLIKESSFDTDEITEQQLEILKSTDSSVLFKKLAAKCISLPLLPFAAYLSGKTIKEAAASPAYLYAQSKLPKLFNSLKEMEVNAELENLFDGSSFKSAHFSPGSDFKKLMSDLSDDFSVHPGQAEVRIMRITVTRRKPMKSKEESEDLEKKSSLLSEDDKKSGENLARCYGMYKISLCQELSEFHRDLDNEKIALLTTSQHLL